MLFNPDGSPYSPGGGERTWAYSAWEASSGEGIPGDDTQMTQVPFGSQINYLEGFEVVSGDLIIDAPAGVYLAAISPSWNWAGAPTPPADDGVALIQLVHVSDETEVMGVSVTLNTLYDTDPSLGQAGFNYGQDLTRLGVFATPNDGHFELRAMQSVQMGEPMPYNGNLTIVKF
jgi:hypothetical protein